MTIHETMLSTFAEICAELAARGSYTGAAVASLTEQVCWENLFHKIRDRAEPVYVFDANGLLPDALKYRGRKLFDSNATLLWREPTHSEEDEELNTTRSLEMWLLEDMTMAVTSCFQVDYDGGDGDYTTEYREYKGSQWPSTEVAPDLFDFLEHLADLCPEDFDSEEDVIYES